MKRISIVIAFLFWSPGLVYAQSDNPCDHHSGDEGVTCNYDQDKREVLISAPLSSIAKKMNEHFGDAKLRIHSTREGVKGSYFKLGESNDSFRITHFDREFKGRNYRYSVNQLDSKSFAFKQRPNGLLGELKMEKKKTELIGRCRKERTVGKGDRKCLAPDVDWDNASFDLRLSPVLHDNSVAWKVERVVAGGLIRLSVACNNVTFPCEALELGYKKKIRSATEKNVRRSFNKPEQKQEQADLLRADFGGVELVATSVEAKDGRLLTVYTYP